MERDEKPDASQLFLVRLWADDGGGRGGGDGPGSDGMSHVHGKVQHVLSGRAAHFSDWHSLVESLSKMIPHQAGAERKYDPLHKEETMKEVEEDGTKV
jgi:hypothetical protein